MNLFRFEALGLLPKRKEVFDGLTWGQDRYWPIPVDLERLHRLCNMASIRLGYSEEQDRVYIVFYRQDVNPIYVLPAQRRAKPLWRKFQKAGH